MRYIAEVELSTVVGKVGQHNAEIDETGKYTGAKTTNRRWRDLGNVHRADNGGLTDSQASDETTCVDGAEVTVVAEKDGDTDDPDNAELSCGPDTTNAIADQESADYRSSEWCERERG